MWLFLVKTVLGETLEMIVAVQKLKKKMIISITKIILLLITTYCKISE